MSYEQDHVFMARAIELSEYGSMVEKTGGAFGAVVVKDGMIIGEGYNQVIKHCDPTWHAEMHAIREACKKLGTPHLDGCTLYTSAESCPMCLAAAYWAHIARLVYGAHAEDAEKYGNFSDVDIYSEVRKKPQERRIKHTELMRSEAIVVWKKFAQMPDRAHY